MADTKQNITELPVKIASGIAATDYLLGIDAGEGYQMLIQDLGDYIIQNVTSALGGAAAETLVDALAGKVPAPDEDGTAGQVLRTNGDGTTEWEDNASAEEIAADVTDWLDEHVAGGTTLAIDNTLTISGAAADSKAAGDRIEAVGDTVDDLSGTVETLSGTVETLSDTKAPAIYSTASGALATFSDGADDMPIKSLTVDIEPVQAGSGDPSPENVRPISGWTGVTVARTGKNLLGGKTLGDAIVDAVNVPSNTYLGSDAEGDYVTFSGNNALTGVRFTNGMRFKPNTQYTFIITAKRNPSDGNSQSTNLMFFYTDGTYTAIGFPTAPSAVAKSTFAYTSAANRTIQSIGTYWGSGRLYLYYNESGIFEGTLTADDFEPYTGDTYDIALPTSAGTVYGGTLDVTAGTLTVDRATKVISAITSLAGSNYIKSDATDGYIVDSDISPKTGAGTFKKNVLSDTLKYKTAYIWASVGHPNCFNIHDQQIHINIANDLLGITDPSSETTATAKEKLNAYLAAHPVTITIPVAPQTYTLDPTTIRTLLGYNAMWADCGDVENVTYPADTKMYIDGLTQPDSDMVADANIQSGKYFSVNNKLYLATAAIAAGEAIVPGTNCTETSLADALNTINS